MECARCKAVIADKAIVCYRCGAPTSMPVAPERPARPARSRRSLAAASLALAAVAGWGAWGAAPGSLQQWFASLLAAIWLAAAFLLWRRRKSR